jgi:hypothetical protein
LAPSSGTGQGTGRSLMRECPALAGAGHDRFDAKYAWSQAVRRPERYRAEHRIEHVDRGTIGAVGWLTAATRQMRAE